MDIYIIMHGFGLAFVVWILAKGLRFIVHSSSNPNNIDF